jgi:hypothetical protein
MQESYKAKFENALTNSLRAAVVNTATISRIGLKPSTRYLIKNHKRRNMASS